MTITVTVTVTSVFTFWILPLTCASPTVVLFNIEVSGILYCTVVGAMLCIVGSMFSVNSSLVQLFVSSRLSVLTTYVCRCHTSLTVMPLSVNV